MTATTAVPRSRFAPTDLDQILLDVSRVEMAPERGMQLRERLTDDIDWEALLEAARWHGLEPLLLRHLEALQVPTPEGLLESLHDRYLATVRRNLLQTVELHRVVGAFADAGIRTLAFKGPVSAALYGSPGLRDFGDLDVVVPRADIRSAMAILSDMDFEPWAQDVESVLKDRSQYGVPYNREEDQISVDLHWGFAWNWFGRTLEFDDLWDRSQETVLTGTPVRVFSDSDQLLHMAMHGSKHTLPWAKLKWVTDMGELMRSRPPESFDDLPAPPRALGAGAILAFGVALARDFHGSAVPPALERQIDEHPRVLDHLDWVAGCIFTHGAGGRTAKDEVQFNLALRERRWDRWMYSWRRLTTTRPRDRKALDLPRSLEFLYPAFRLGRLGIKYADPRRLAQVLKRR